MPLTRKRTLCWYVGVFMTLCLVICIPKPSWLSCAPAQDKSVSSSQAALPKGAVKKLKEMPDVIDPRERGVVRMFHIYNDTFFKAEEALQKLKLERKDLDEKLVQPTAKLKILPSTVYSLPSHLQPSKTMNYSNSESRVSDTTSILTRGEIRNRRPVLKDGESHNSTSPALTPECVHFVGPPEMKSAKICIHPREVDRVISLFLRDVGQWEIDRVSDMEWALLAYPDMQLVDLGCNLGVFTLFAAGMGRHVVAVDVLPSNLNLLRTSLTLNDIENHEYVVKMNAKDMYAHRQNRNTVTATSNDGRASAERPGKQKNARVSDSKQAKTDRYQLDDSSHDEIGFDLNDILTYNEKPKSSDRSINYITNKKRPMLRRRKTKRKSRVGRRLQQIGSRQLGQEDESGYVHFDIKDRKADTKYRTKFENDIRDYKHNNLSNSNNINNISLSRHSDVSNQKSGSNSNISKTYSISQLVTVLHNAVYSDRTSQLGVYVKPDGNIGGTEVHRTNSPLLESQKESQQLLLVDTICLDDLLPLVHAPSVFLKMDVEGSEPHVLECGQKFFEKVRVRYVLMEWLYMYQLKSKDHDSSARFMIRFLMAKGFIPTTKMGVDVKGGVADNRGVTVLDVDQWDKWPDMVLWMER